MYKIIQGDCIEIMKTFPDNYVTTIITDPPYGLAFMGKEWDNFGTDLQKYQEWTRLWASEALRVAKPGTTLLCFGGTRTFHRLTCGLEDAGWFIKDVLMWLYGNGFPKSLDISKAIDKIKGAEREKIEYEHWGRRNRSYQPNGSPFCFDKEKVKDKQYKTLPSTSEAKEWEGYGSALKPAYEPIVMAMKPYEGSYAKNALKWGVAGLNIDGCRIGTQGGVKKVNIVPNSGGLGGEGFGCNGDLIDLNKGRFPANVILDGESAELLDKQSKNASRFFYCAKASKSERTANGQIENSHPTVKPIELIKYLVKLASPPQGLILDPFAGSGTTCVASKILGYDCIGIEKEQSYIKIAKKRLEAVKVNDVLF
jgi:site-specific DNA-methyltransferase (adenine-specific)